MVWRDLTVTIQLNVIEQLNLRNFYNNQLSIQLIHINTIGILI